MLPSARHLLLVAVPLLLCGCFDNGNSFSGDAPISATDCTGTFCTAYTIFQEHGCFAGPCHAERTSWTSADYVSHHEVVARSPSTSPIYTQVQSGAMPKAPYPGLSAAEIQSIADWINSL